MMCRPSDASRSPEAQIVADAELEPVEVASHVAVRLHDEDDRRVAPLLLARIVLVLEAGSVRDGASMAVWFPTRKCQPPFLARMVAAVLGEDARPFRDRLLERLVRVDADRDDVELLADRPAHSLRPAARLS